MSRSRQSSDHGAPPSGSSRAPGPVGALDGVGPRPARAAPSAPSAPVEGGGPVTLGSTGAIAISHAAALDLIRDLGWQGREEERARRYLLALAADARPVDREVSPEQWRAHRRSTRLDVSLRVTREQPIAALPPIAVVIGCRVRRVGGRRG